MPPPNARRKAGSPAADAPEIRFDDLPDEAIAEALARLSAADLARARRLSRRCRDVHVRDAEAVVARRIEAAVVARGRRTVAAGECHTV